MALGLSRTAIDSAGGIITSGSPTVFINGFPAARNGDTVASHGLPPHAAAVLVSSPRLVFINGLMAATTNDVATCGHSVSGSTTVLTGV